LLPRRSIAGSTLGTRCGGQPIERKNVDRLLDAVDELATHPDATLSIVGDGPERDRLERKQESLTHTDRVDFLGFLDDYEDVLGQMHAADVFASPSTREGFGLTFVEAMAADCTVIAADHPDSAADEVIGDAGFCVAPTVDALAERLDAALGGARPPTSPAEHAQQYDWDAIAEQALSAYQCAVDGSW
jgi:glycosyltransferase involved in cell wall biosynthesis